MLNKDYYKDAIFELAFRGKNIAVVNGEPVSCTRTSCGDCELCGTLQGCRVARFAWANSEHIDKVDWTKVKKDTPILVRNNINDYWHRRYFANFDGDKVFAYSDGGTSWSASKTDWWLYARLSPITDEKGTN